MRASRTTPEAQQLAARVAGFTLLLLMASGFTGILAFGRHPVVDGDVVATTQNLLAHEQEFRGGLMCEIVILNCDNGVSA